MKLTDAEWKIIELLWDNGSLTTMEIIRELKDSLGRAKSTTITLLNRMDDKGSVRYEIEGKTKKYYPTIQREEAELEETKSFLDKFYDGNIGLMISNLIKQEALSKEDLEEIEKIIKEGE